MDTLKEILIALMILIPVAAAPRAIFCIGKIASDPDQDSTYKARLKNLFVFVLIAECALDLIFILQKYLL